MLTSSRCSRVCVLFFLMLAGHELDIHGLWCKIYCNYQCASLCKSPELSIQSVFPCNDTEIIICMWYTYMCHAFSFSFSRHYLSLYRLFAFGNHRIVAKCCLYATWSSFMHKMVGFSHLSSIRRFCGRTHGPP